MAKKTEIPVEPLFLDIETGPQDPEEFMVPDPATMEPPANYKKAESIAEWRKEKAATLMDELRDRSSLEALLGGIVVSVGVARGSRPVTVLTAPSLDEAGELALLRKLEVALVTYSMLPIVTWNGSTFDIPFLARRALRHGLYNLAGRVYRYDEKPWSTRFVDCMKVWQAHDRQAKGKLAEVAQYLGVETRPDTLRGAGVAAALARGEVQAVTEHCAADVERLRGVYWRMRAAGWVEGVDVPPEVATRPPRTSARARLLAACAEVQVDTDKGTIRAAAEAAGIVWVGKPPGEDGPQIDLTVSEAQLRTFLVEMQTRRLPQAAPSEAA